MQKSFLKMVAVSCLLVAFQASALMGEPAGPINANDAASRPKPISYQIEGRCSQSGRIVITSLPSSASSTKYWGDAVAFGSAELNKNCATEGGVDLGTMSVKPLF